MELLVPLLFWLGLISAFALVDQSSRAREAAAKEAEDNC
jgi:hypothetical protein